MPLPTNISPIVNSLSGKKFFIYGEYKIGKSTFCNQFPNPLFFDTERGLEQIECYKDYVNTWQEYKNNIAELYTKKNDFKTVILDSIDNLYEACRIFVLEKAGKIHESDLGYAKGWKLVESEFRQGILKLLQLNKTAIFVSHSRQKEIDTRTGKVLKIVPTLSSKPADFLLGISDFILYVDMDLGTDKIERRVIRTQPTVFYQAGCKLEKGKILPAKILLDYESFVKSYNDAVNPIKK